MDVWLKLKEEDIPGAGIIVAMWTPMGACLVRPLHRDPSTIVVSQSDRRTNSLSSTPTSKKKQKKTQFSEC